jgi:hypothetical protein
VAQPVERSSFDNTLAHQILFQSGRALRFHPISPGAFQGSRVGICWMEAACCARRARSMLFADGPKRSILTINPASTVPADASAAH